MLKLSAQAPTMKKRAHTNTDKQVAGLLPLGGKKNILYIIYYHLEAKYFGGETFSNLRLHILAFTAETTDTLSH